MGASGLGGEGAWSFRFGVAHDTTYIVYPSTPGYAADPEFYLVEIKDGKIVAVGMPTYDRILVRYMSVDIFTELDFEFRKIAPEF